MEDRIAELALLCFDGNPEKATALLELLKISLQLDEDKIPEVKQPVCVWEREGQCFKDIPDSLRACKKPCAFLEIDVK